MFPRRNFDTTLWISVYVKELKFTQFRCKQSECKAVTGGIIVLEGKATNQDITIMTGGALQKI
jgi:hypothetical protein